MSASSKRALNEIETQLVEQSQSLEGLSHRELTELARQLRGRRERVRRMIRDRNRAARKAGGTNPDTGAREKKELLIAAIERVSAALDASSYAEPAGEGAPKSSKPKPKPKSKPQTKPKSKPASAKPAAAKPAEAKSAAPKAAAKKSDKADEGTAPKKKPAAAAAPKASASKKPAK